MKRNYLGLALSLLLAAPAVVHAQFFYTFGEGSTSYIITGYYGPDDSVGIPATIDNLYVTAIGDNAFLEETGVTNVTIPSSVTTIGANAFAQSGLTSVTIPGTVNSIGASAFANCPDLTNATIADGVISIGASAFNGCPALANVTIPSSVIGIEPYAFSSCRSLTNLTLASGLISIGDGAFDATGLTSITVPGSVTNIGPDALSSSAQQPKFYFLGNAPSTDPLAFNDDSGTVYYLPGTTGWSNTLAGLPTALWTLPYPSILNSSSSFGVQSNGFGFTVSWATNRPVVVQASEDLANPVWTPVQTNAMTNGVFNFSDPQWTNYPGRFYRVMSQ